MDGYIQTSPPERPSRSSVTSMPNKSSINIHIHSLMSQKHSRRYRQKRLNAQSKQSLMLFPFSLQQCVIHYPNPKHVQPSATPAAAPNSS